MAGSLTIKTDGRTFTLDRLTLGDWRVLKREFGLTAEDLLTTVKDDKGKEVQGLNFKDPEVTAGLIAVALTHERPDAPLADLVKEVFALTMDGFEVVDPDAEVEVADPTKAGDSEETADHSTSGKSAKSRKKPGDPSTPKS